MILRTYAAALLSEHPVMAAIDSSASLDVTLLALARHTKGNTSVGRVIGTRRNPGGPHFELLVREPRGKDINRERF